MSDTSAEFLILMKQLTQLLKCWFHVIIYVNTSLHSDLTESPTAEWAPILLWLLLYFACCSDPLMCYDATCQISNIDRNSLTNSSSFMLFFAIFVSHISHTCTDSRYIQNMRMRKGREGGWRSWSQFVFLYYAFRNNKSLFQRQSDRSSPSSTCFFLVSTWETVRILVHNLSSVSVWIS